MTTEPLNTEAIQADLRTILFVSDGSSGSDKVARLLRATELLLDENATLRAQLADAEAKGYDEALKAFAWCLDNGPAEHALPYVIEQNPYRATRTQKPPTGEQP